MAQIGRLGRLGRHVSYLGKLNGISKHSWHALIKQKESVTLILWFFAFSGLPGSRLIAQFALTTNIKARTLHTMG